MKILLYYHTGSKNHGCEAIVKTICYLFSNDEIILYSYDSISDKQFGLNSNLVVKQCAPRKANYSIWERIKIRLHLYQEGQECFAQMLDEKEIDWAFAIGGDNYCYKGQPEELAYLNRKLHNKGIKTALFGCSINEDVIAKKTVKNDLNLYNIIIARESLTYSYLQKNHINNAYLFPDTAFILPSKEKDSIIKGFNSKKEYVGINMSPLIAKSEQQQGIVYRNYEKLIDDIITHTHYDILLIPHVFVEWDNDLETLTKLYDRYKDTNRIAIVKEDECSVLKWYVAQCRFVVCARTHVSIAAYSQGIPTLVVGYSVKSKGIAKDLFGTDEEYVIPVESIKTEDCLMHAFEWLTAKEKEMKELLLTKEEAYQKKLNSIQKLFL